jgi:hypothetical protein
MRCRHLDLLRRGQMAGSLKRFDEFSGAIRGGPKNFRNCYKSLFKIFVQIWNFSPLQSTVPVTGCSNPCDAPTAGNIVWNLQQKSCQWLLAILVESLQRQHNASISKPTSSVGTKNVARSEIGWVGVVGHHNHFVFSQKLLDAQGSVGLFIFKKNRQTHLQSLRKNIRKTDTKHAVQCHLAD